MKPFNILLAIAALALFVQCKSTKELGSKHLKSMPSSFASFSDTANSAKLNWTDYFSDSNLVVLIDEAVKNNSDVLMALQRIEKARASVQLRQGALFPNLNVNLSYLQRKFGYYTMDDAGNRTTFIEPAKIIPTHLPDYYLGLQTSWEADIWGRLRNRKKAALARYLSGIEGKNLVVTNLVAEVCNTYYKLLALDEELEVVKQSIKLRENALELIKVQMQAGASNEISVKQFEAQYYNAEALEYEIRQEITECENKINFLIMRYPQKVTRGTFEKQLSFKPKVGIPSHLLKNRPDIRQAELEMIASNADVKAARAAFYPSLNITGSMGFQGYKAALLFTTPQSMAYSVLGSLITPLINRSAIKAEFKSASAGQIEAFYNYQKKILNGYVEVYNEVARIKNLEKITEFKTQEVEALSQSIDASKFLFQSGRSNYLEVLMVNNNSLAAQLELIESKKRQYYAWVNIYKALGGGWR